MIKRIRISVEGYYTTKEGHDRDIHGDRRWVKPDDPNPPMVFESLSAFFDFLVDIGEYDEITLTKKHTVADRVIKVMKGRD